MDLGLPENMSLHKNMARPANGFDSCDDTPFPPLNLLNPVSLINLRDMTTEIGDADFYLISVSRFSSLRHFCLST